MQTNDYINKLIQLNHRIQSGSDSRQLYKNNSNNHLMKSTLLRNNQVLAIIAIDNECHADLLKGCNTMLYKQSP